MTNRRRQLLGLLGVFAGGAALSQTPALWSFFVPPRLAFTPLDRPAGFRRLEAGAASAALDPLVGLPTRVAESIPATGERDLCSALFEAPPPAETVPIAAFSDFLCPYCRVLTDQLATLARTPGSGVRIAWHEWPILGPTSQVAARAALAAKRQGAYVPFQQALNEGAFLPTPTVVGELAARLGLDADRLLADMAGAAVEAELASTRDLARVFAFEGTPSLIVGRTVVSGAIDKRTLEALIDQERRDGPIPVCA